MEQRISLVTLAVPDVAVARRFFEQGLGWTVNSAPNPQIVFFQTGGSVLALYAREALSAELGLSVTETPMGAMTIAWNGRSEEEVDAAWRQAVSAGARPVKEPEKAFWGGYSSYVEVPGGHLMEIAYNPFWPVETDGSITLPPPQ
ncbi:VOC family protein [Rhodobacterales bacterium]|nr:VOC family protein [Rhodobacterales bacterium]